MASASLAIFAGAVLLLALALGALTYFSLNRPHLHIAERARAVVAELKNRSTVPEPRPVRRMIGWLLVPLFHVLGRMPLIAAADRDRFVNMLRLAGFRHPSALQYFVGVKILGGASFAAATLVGARLLAPELAPALPWVGALGALFLGLVLPEFLLKRVVARRRREIIRGIPDVLDLMVICTNGGYSLGPTLRRVAAEFQALNPTLADELRLTADDISLHGEPMAGLRNLDVRTGIPALNAMVTTLIQSQRYGTPITHALKTLAQTERRSRILALEEKGAKLSTMITIPMMVFILPAVLIIAAGPAMLRITEAFAK